MPNEIEMKTLIGTLEERHRNALEWFADNRGNDKSLPRPIDMMGVETRLWTQAKGIYKPKWSEYALSIKEVIDSPYAHREIRIFEDGSWSYEYHQEGQDPTIVDSYYTNTALMKNIRDKVPVGVFKQQTKRPSIYLVHGLAMVEKYEDGYFFLKGFSDNQLYESNINRAVQKLLDEIGREDDQETLGHDIDLRERTLREIVKRRGQKKFRANLLVAFKMQCAITGCNALSALEAAHIDPYKGIHTNTVNNGLLLRADIHTLWDLGFIWIDERTMLIKVHRSLMETSYSSLHNQNPNLPSATSNSSFSSALNRHRKYCQDQTND